MEAIPLIGSVAEVVLGLLSEIVKQLEPKLAVAAFADQVLIELWMVQDAVSANDKRGLTADRHGLSSSPAEEAVVHGRD